MKNSVRDTDFYKELFVENKLVLVDENDVKYEVSFCQDECTIVQYEKDYTLTTVINPILMYKFAETALKILDELEKNVTIISPYRFVNSFSLSDDFSLYEEKGIFTIQDGIVNICKHYIQYDENHNIVKDEEDFSIMGISFSRAFFNCFINFIDTSNISWD